MRSFRTPPKQKKKKGHSRARSPTGVIFWPKYLKCEPFRVGEGDDGRVAKTAQQLRYVNVTGGGAEASGLSLSCRLLGRLASAA